MYKHRRQKTDHITAVALREARWLSSMSIEEASREMGIPPLDLYKMELGGKVPTEYIVKFVKAYKKPEKFFYYEKLLE